MNERKTVFHRFSSYLKNFPAEQQQSNWIYIFLLNIFQLV